LATLQSRREVTEAHTMLECSQSQTSRSCIANYFVSKTNTWTKHARVVPVWAAVRWVHGSSAVAWAESVLSRYVTLL